jgi:Transcription factor zinc-finger
MADDEKDRLGEKLRRKEKADEDRFFAERDQELLERLRQQKTAAEPAEPAASTRMRCPRCGADLVTALHHGMTAAECPGGHGMWLDDADLEVLAARERDSWLGRFFHRPRR